MIPHFIVTDQHEHRLNTFWTSRCATLSAMSFAHQVIDGARGITARSLVKLPRSVIRRLAGDPVVVDGKTLDPEMQLLIRLLKLEGPAIETLAMSKARSKFISGFQIVGGRQPIGAVTDRNIDGPGGPLPLRFYTPSGLTGQAPALVYFHGGGWMHGNLDSHDATCRFLAEEAQAGRDCRARRPVRRFPTMFRC